MNLSTRILAALALVSLAPIAAAGDSTCQLQLVDAEQNVEVLICTPNSSSSTTTSADGTGHEISIEDPSIQRYVGSIGVVI